jgi:hypothetical protein
VGQLVPPLRRGIHKAEFQNLVNFLNAKQVKIANISLHRLIGDDDEERKRAEAERAQLLT